MAEARPFDECPFARPLPEGFDGCPTFHPVRFVPLTSTFEPLHPVLSCRHMQLGLRADQPGRAYYCRCAVGGPQARADLAAETDLKRQALMRELADGIMAVVMANWQQLAEAKGRELASRDLDQRLLARREVASVAASVDHQMHEVVEGRFRDHVDQLGIDPAALLEVIDAGVEDFETRGFASWSPPAHLLAKLPPDVAAFLRPASSALEDARPA